MALVIHICAVNLDSPNQGLDFYVTQFLVKLTFLDDLDAMAIQLPYAGERAVMEILLPNKRSVCYDKKKWRKCSWIAIPCSFS